MLFAFSGIHEPVTACLEPVAVHHVAAAACPEPGTLRH